MNTIETGKWRPRNMKIALIAEETDWGRGVCDTWRELARKYGFEVVSYEIVDPKTLDFYSVLTKIKQYDPAIIKAELSNTPSGVALVKQVKELGIKALIFPGYSAEVHEFENLAGSYADYCIYYGYPVPKSWVNHLLEVFPDSDPTGAFWGYDSILILADAIEKAGSFDTDKVREALLKYPHKGLWGTYVFHPQTHRALWGGEYVTPGAVEFYQGKRYFIWPERLKEGEWTYPYHDFIPPPS
jgi:branched-chain amino acid transport system substrate-binding protein